MEKEKVVKATNALDPFCMWNISFFSSYNPTYMCGMRYKIAFRKKKKKEKKSITCFPSF